MKQELGKEIREFLRDRKLLTSSAVPIPFSLITSFLLYYVGNRDILKFGVYIYFVLWVCLNAYYILRAKEIRTVDNFVLGKAEEQLVNKYPALRPYAKGSLILSSMTTLAVLFLPPLNGPVHAVFYGTPTATPTQTLTPTIAPTLTASATPRPVADYLYYMIVLDASSAMGDSFHGLQTWTVALKSVNEILQKLNPNAHFGLVIIGGSSSAPAKDPCGDPPGPAVTFTSRDAVWDYTVNLQPQGGGSFERAFTVAKNQLENLPPDAIKTLVFVTGLKDTCPDDEWAQLGEAIQLAKTLDLYSEIIILDENGPKSQTIAEHIASLAENVNAQAPASLPAVETVYNTVISNVNIYVHNEIVALAVDHHELPTAILLPTNTVAPAETGIVPTSTFKAEIPTAIPTIFVVPTDILPTQVLPTPIPTAIPWDTQCPNDIYGAVKVTNGGEHYQVREKSTNRVMLQTQAQFGDPNDVKACAFSGDGRFAAAYHYKENGGYTWIGIWNIATGQKVGERIEPGYQLDISGVFN